jgi:DNA-damage-inducible protein J
MTNITVRIDSEVKRKAEQLFEKLGMSMSGAINIFFRQAITEQAIPFPIRAKTQSDKYDEYFTTENVQRILESIAQAERGEVVIKTLAELEEMEND